MAQAALLKDYITCSDHNSYSLMTLEQPGSHNLSKQCNHQRFNCNFLYVNDMHDTYICMYVMHIKMLIRNARIHITNLRLVTLHICHPICENPT